MKCLARAALVVASLAALPTLAAEQWREFKPANAGFSVLMPGQPQAEVQPIKGSTEPNHLFGVNDQGRSFIVSYADYPAEAVKKASADDLFKGVEHGAAEAIHGSIRSDRSIVAFGHPAREAVIDGPSHTMKARYFLAGRRFYQVAYFGPKGSESSPEATNFLDSFRVTGQ